MRSTGVPFVGDLPYGVYLSSDDNFDPGDELVHTGNQFVAGLSTASLNTTFRLSNRVTIASWNVIVATDPSNALPESNESNNASSSNGRLTINGADLYISEASGPSTGFIGRDYPISITIRNEGQADANDFRFAVYTSENEFITVTDPQIYVSQSATIAQGGQQTFQFDVTLPTYTSSQTVWLGVIADVFSNVSESRESNNVRRLPESVSVVFPIPDLEGTIIRLLARSSLMNHDIDQTLVKDVVKLFHIKILPHNIMMIYRVFVFFFSQLSKSSQLNPSI